MALYSFHHRVISNAVADSAGKTAAHLNYITRHGVVIYKRMILTSVSRIALAAFAKNREELAGANGRVCESFIVALPIEATRDQHAELVSSLAEHITDERAAWICSLHYDRNGNPHCHLACFDEDEPRSAGQRGRSRKIIGLSRDGALDDLRAAWTEIHNRMMDGFGYGPEGHIDHRSFVAQSSANIPTLHEGPKVRAMTASGRRPQSKNQLDRGREVRWKEIDEGLLRTETNALVRELNQLNQKKYEENQNERRRINKLSTEFIDPDSSNARRSAAVGDRSDNDAEKRPEDFRRSTNDDKIIEGAYCESASAGGTAGHCDDTMQTVDPAALWQDLSNNIHHISRRHRVHRRRNRGKYRPARLRRLIESFRTLKKLSVNQITATLSYLRGLPFADVKKIAAKERQISPSRLLRPPRVRRENVSETVIDRL